MKSGMGVVPNDVTYPILGLDTLSPSNEKDPRLSPDLQNVVVLKGILQKRKGYQTIGGDLTDPVIALVEFETADAVKILIAITTKKEYKYDAAGDAWTNITYQETATDVDRTGDEEDTIDWSVLIGTDDDDEAAKWFVFTNGKDKPRYWDGTMDKFGLYEPDIPSFVTCRAIAQFYGHVVLANVTTTDQARQAVIWSDTGKLLDFTGENSGLQTVTEASGDLLRLIPLGDRLVIYADNSISMIAYVGGSIIYSFETSLQETRLVSPRCVVNIGPFHVFMSQEDIVLFDGSRLTTPIGQKIYREYREILSVEHRERSFAFHDSAKRTIWFAVPIDDATSIFYTLEYNLQDYNASVWLRQRTAARPYALGFFSRDNTLAWDSPALAGLSWNQITFTWGQASLRKAFPVRVIGTSSRVLLNDETLPNDSNTVIESYWDSIDFTVPGAFESENGRWLEIEIELSGIEVDVYISIDEGETYTLLEHLELTPKFVVYKVLCDVVSPHTRVRLKNACLDSDFLFTGFLRLWCTPAGITG